MRTAWTTVLAIALAGVQAAGAAKGAPPEDTRTVQQLLAAMGTDVAFEREDAAKALAAKGKEVLPAILKALMDKNVHLRRGATDALAAMGADANSAAPQAANALRDKDAWVRAGAARALGQMGELPDKQAKALAAAAGDADPWVREVTLSVLRNATKDKALLVKAACEAIRIPHTSWGICRHAMGVLRQHGPSDPKRVTAALLKMLSDPPQGMWDGGSAAVELLMKMGTAKQAVPVLVRLLGHPDIRTADRAAQRLAQIGPDANDALPALRKMAAKGITDERAKKAVTRAIALLEGKPDPYAKKAKRK